MPRLTIAKKYQKAINDTVKLAIADTVGLMNVAGSKKIEEAASILRDTLPAVTDTYGAVVGELSVNYYDEARAAAAVPSKYQAKVVANKVGADTQSAIGFTIANLVKGTELATATSILSGGVQRILNGVNRDTISYNIATDPDGTMYQRVPSANGCAFCLAIAVEAELLTEDLGTQYHDNCHCETVPVFTGQKPIRMDYYDAFAEDYSMAKYDLEAKRGDIYPDWLAKWKAEGGRTGKNLTRDFLKAHPELSLTTENILSVVRSNTGRR